jgi:HAD superfamily phosphatase (TIGR01668 family)
MNRNQLRTFTPTYYHQSVFDIPLHLVKAKGYQYLLCDLDNTLASFRDRQPSAKVKAFLLQCQQLGLNLMLVSNNKETRVKPYADALSIPFLFDAKKPFPTKVLKFLEEKGYPKDKVMVIGDQLLTDVWLANRLGVSSIFVERFVPYDHWPTRINRFFERRIKRQLIRHSLLHPLEG